MKRLLTLFVALVVAGSLAMPVYAQKKGGKKAAAATGEHGKAHEKHAKKKGATEGKKKGQQGTTPSEKPKS